MSLADEVVEREEGFAELTLPKALMHTSEALRCLIENNPDHRDYAINAAVRAVNEIGAVIAHIRGI